MRLVVPIARTLLGLVFGEAALYYSLAGFFRRRSWNVYLAAAAACGALWQFMGYFGVDASYYTMLYAGLGLGCRCRRELGATIGDRGAAAALRLERVRAVAAIGGVSRRGEHQDAKAAADQAGEQTCRPSDHVRFPEGSVRRAPDPWGEA